MGKPIFIFLIIAFSIVLGSTKGNAQFFDFSKPNPYQKVFVDTDDFDAGYLNTLEESLPKIENDTLYFLVLNDLAYYWHTRNLSTALMFAKKGLAKSEEKKNKRWHGKFQVTQAAILLRMEKLDSAEVVLLNAKNNVLPQDLPLLYTQMGYVYERRGNLGKAADYAMEVLQLGEKQQDLWAKAMAYSDLSNLFWKQSKFEKGLEYGLKSVEIFKERGIADLDYDFTLYVVGNNYLALNNHAKALEFYQKASEIGERYGFYNNLSDIYISLVELYTKLSKFEKAETAGANAIKYAKLLDNNFMLMRSWLSVGKLQLVQNKNTLAIESLNKSIAIATNNFGDGFYLSQAYEALGQVHANLQNYKEAYAAFTKYNTLKDKVFTAEADQRISLLQTEFEVAQKESTIQLQETQLKRQQTRQVLLGIIAVLLILFLAFLFKAYQINKKKNKQLQKQNEENELLLKEIHHRVKNNLEIISSLLALQSAQLKDGNLIDAMQESQNRVQSMGMIHQKLYQGKNLTAIEMKEYFTNLGNYIVNSFGLSRHIEVRCEMDALELDVDTAIPIGLIVNELLTNSLKYGFPAQKQGLIIISLVEFPAQLKLKVTDNGIGKAESAQASGTGFGTQLIELLTKQLDGKMVELPHPGTAISFEFKLNKAA